MSSDALPIDDELLRHSRFLRGLAGKLVGPEEAEDVLQDAWLALRDRPPRAASKLRGWLAIVVANLARNRRRGDERRRLREESIARPEREEPAASALEQLELQRVLGELVVSLPPEQRIVLYLRYFEDLTPSAIAARLGVPLKTIQTRHTRALATLRARLDERSKGDRSEWVSALLPWARRQATGTRAPGLGKLAAGTLAVAALGLVWFVRGEHSGEAGAMSVAAGPGEPTSAVPAAAPLEPRIATPTASSRVEITPDVQQSAREEPPPGNSAERTVFVIEVDLARVRSLGWPRPEANDQQALERTAAVIERRFAAMRRSVDLSIDPARSRIELRLSSSGARDRELCSELLQGMGICEFFWAVDEDLVLALNLPFDLRAEREKLDAWRQTNPSSPLELFHSIPTNAGGPHPRLCWMTPLFGNLEGRGLEGSPLPVLLPDRLEDHVGAGSVLRCAAETDDFGYPALSLELRETRWDDFLRLTWSRLDSRLALALEGRIRSAPTVNDVHTRGRMLVEGRFTRPEVERLAEQIAGSQGPLRVVQAR